MLSSHPSINLLAAEERANPEIWDILLCAGWYAEKKERLIGKATDIRGLRGNRLLKAIMSHRGKVTTSWLGKAARFSNIEGFKVLLDYITPKEINKSSALSIAAISYFVRLRKWLYYWKKGRILILLLQHKLSVRTSTKRSENATYGDSLRERHFILLQIGDLKIL